MDPEIGIGIKACIQKMQENIYWLGVCLNKNMETETEKEICPVCGCEWNVEECTCMKFCYSEDDYSP